MEDDRVNFGRNVPRHDVEQNPKQMEKNQKQKVFHSSQHAWWEHRQPVIGQSITTTLGW